MSIGNVILLVFIVVSVTAFKYKKLEEKIFLNAVQVNFLTSTANEIKDSIRIHSTEREFLQKHSFSFNSTPIRVLILSNWKSGSSFLGNTLSRINPSSTFSIFEPLHQIGVTKIRDSNVANPHIERLAKFLRCNIDQEFINYTQNHHYLLPQNWIIHCLKYPRHCMDSEFLNLYCKLHPIMLMKVLRLSLNLIETLFKIEEFKMVYLVRDPRAIMASRWKQKWCKGDCLDINNICDDLVVDFKTARQFQRKYPNRMFVVRYEDLVARTKPKLQKLCKGLGLDVLIQKNGPYAMVNGNIGGWRVELSSKNLKEIHRACGSALDVWGYLDNPIQGIDVI